MTLPALHAAGDVRIGLADDAAHFLIAVDRSVIRAIETPHESVPEESSPTMPPAKATVDVTFSVIDAGIDAG